MTMASKAGMTRMPPMPLVMGSMMSGDRHKAMFIGGMLHYIVMGTVVFGIGYALLFQAFGSSAWLTGVLIGVVHGLAVGLVFMPMMPAMHSRMDAQLVGVGAPAHGAVVQEVGGEVWLCVPPNVCVNAFAASLQPCSRMALRISARTWVQCST